ncbi:dTDP-epi-vancosaminyltransferase [Streptomyces glaucescens]
MCTPPDFAELFDSVGLALVPVGEPVRPFVKGVLTGKTNAPAEGPPARAAAMTATTYEAVVTAAEECDVILATGLLPAAPARGRQPSAWASPTCSLPTFPAYLPSPHHPPFERSGRPFPPGVTDNRVLWDWDTETMNVLFGTGLNTHRASIGLPPVSHFRDYVLTDRPRLAADPVLSP